MSPRRAAAPDEPPSAAAYGRVVNRTIRAYLKALEAQKPRPGRPRTAATVEARMAAISDALPTAPPLRRLQLAQERVDLRCELDELTTVVDISEFESNFIDVASSYSAAKGISYKAWRESGVPAAVLKRAGIGRASKE